MFLYNKLKRAKYPFAQSNKYKYRHRRLLNKLKKLYIKGEPCYSESSVTWSLVNYNLTAISAGPSQSNYYLQTPVTINSISQSFSPATILAICKNTITKNYQLTNSGISNDIPIWQPIKINKLHFQHYIKWSITSHNLDISSFYLRMYVFKTYSTKTVSSAALLEAMHGPDRTDVPRQVTDGYIPGYKSNLYTLQAYLIKDKLFKIQNIINNAQPDQSYCTSNEMMEYTNLSYHARQTQESFTNPSLKWNLDDLPFIQIIWILGTNKPQIRVPTNYAYNPQINLQISRQWTLYPKYKRVDIMNNLSTQFPTTTFSLSQNEGSSSSTSASQDPSDITSITGETSSPIS